MTIRVALAGAGAFGIKHLDGLTNIDDVEVVSFSQSALRKLIKTQPDAATKLLFNMARLLCMKVVETAK